MTPSAPRPHPPASATLSVCMIVKNEANELGDCLRSIRPAADEIIVVDTGSTDATKAVAQAGGARVFDFSWRQDFSAARNESLGRATGDYILWLDADDRMDPEEVEKLQRLKSRLPKAKNCCYYLLLRDESSLNGNIFFYQLRLFPNLPTARFESRVHEQVVESLRQAGVAESKAEVMIRHTGYHDLATIEKKARRNLEIIQTELQDAPGNPVLHFHAARTLANLGRRDEAIQSMRRVLENPEIERRQPRFFLQAGLLLGRYHSEQAQAGLAVSVFRDLQAKFPGIGLLHFYLGAALLQQGNPAGAITELQQSLRSPLDFEILPLNPDLIRFQQYYFLGLGYQQTADPDSAQGMFLKSLEIPAADKALSLESLGLLFLQKADYGQAVHFYEQALQAGNPRDSTCANLGLAFRKLGQLEKAEEMLKLALDKNPDRLEALAQLGYLCLEKKDYPCALTHFARARNLDPKLTDVQLSLCRLYFQFGELEHLVQECGVLLVDLNLSYARPVDGFADLAILFGQIGDALSGQGRSEVAFMAYQVSFRIYPLPEILQKIIAMAQAGKSLDTTLGEIRESLESHAGDAAVMNPLKETLDQLLAAVSGKK